MNYRKRIVGVGTGSGGHPGKSRGGDLEPGLGGTRLEGGVNLDQALAWNGRTCRPDAKGADQPDGPREILSTDAGNRGTSQPRLPAGNALQTLYPDGSIQRTATYCGFMTQ